MFNSFKKYKIIILVAILAIFLRLIFFGIIVSQNNYSMDEVVNRAKLDGYYEISYNLVNNSTFSYSKSNSTILPHTKRTPGYPVILAPFLYFNSTYLVIFLQIILGGLLAILGSLVAWRVVNNKKIAIIVGIFMAIEPVGIWLSVKFLSETFFTLFFILFVLYIIKFLHLVDSNKINHSPKLNFCAAFSGIYLGFATLLRPTTLYLPFFLILFWLIYRFWNKKNKLWISIIAFIIPFIFLLTPWFVRNYKVFENFSYSSIASETLFTYFVPSAMAIKNNHGFSYSQAKFLASQGYDRYPDINLANSGEFQDKAFTAIKQYPYGSMLAAGVALKDFFTHDGTLSFLQEINLISSVEPLPTAADLVHNFKSFIISPFALIAMFRFLWFVIFLTFLLQVLLLWRRKMLNSRYVFLLLLIFYFAATTMFNGFGTNARFRFPVNSLILIFSVSWFIDLSRFLRVKKFL